MGTSDGGLASGSGNGRCLRLRGLPYQADESDVKAFFAGFNVVKASIMKKNSRATGEAFAYFSSEAEASEALRKKNKQSMGNRYIELFADVRGYAAHNSGVGSTTPPTHGAKQSRSLYTDDVSVNKSPYVTNPGHPSLYSTIQTGMTYAQASKESYRGGSVPSATGLPAPGNIERTLASVLNPGGGAAHPGAPGTGYSHSPVGSECNSAASTPGTSSSARSIPGTVNRSVVVRMRGLPFTAQEDDIYIFFEGLSQGMREIVFTLTPTGRPTGEAFVEFGGGDVTLQGALAFHKRKMGKRYIEIFKATQNEMVEAMKECSNKLQSFAVAGGAGSQHQQAPSAASAACPSPSIAISIQAGEGNGPNINANNVAGKARMLTSAPKGTVLKLRGLPYTTEDQDIVQFFHGYRIVGLVLMTRPEKEGRVGICNGVAYVQFATAPEAESAKRVKDKQMMGNRYIECMTHIPKNPQKAALELPLGSREVSKQQEPTASTPSINIAHTNQNHQQGDHQMPLQMSNVENMIHPDMLDATKTSSALAAALAASDISDHTSQEYGGSVSPNQNHIWGATAGLHCSHLSSSHLSSVDDEAPQSLQQQLRKMGLSEKGESLFSDHSLIIQAPIAAGFDSSNSSGNFSWSNASDNTSMSMSHRSMDPPASASAALPAWDNAPKPLDAGGSPHSQQGFPTYSLDAAAFKPLW
eukprot:CAMPEP_0198247440 /NCGR_PEP_ID=MMETSP1446-20131203/46476_1 /TAXON_ID=1461542 ORGANISM="Unidentified sp, Strain CCMP2111" /NCGR_SAMPLE_ID=MMETSP1446 /ASSEMBLY_ACC=CAM_ASM_001112 /LENGTH=696 /DNA_ID=CAMNT_0043931765 /DNA_START=129 /DNA_END=2219 /DNA_ORIENTATION=+